MPSCPSLSNCALYPLFTLKSSPLVWQAHYCNADYQACERYRLAQAGTRVPPNLLPNGKTLQVPAA